MNIQKIELEAQERTDLRKSANSRAKRINDFALGVIYGGKDQPLPISIPHSKILKAVESEDFFTQMLNVKVNGKDNAVILKDLQRHPYKKRILHLDFLRVNADDVVTLKLPIHFLNEDTCIGVKTGGILDKQLIDIEVKSIVSKIPQYIEVDVANLEIDKSIHISDLVLPEGVQSVDLLQGEEHNLTIVVVHKAKQEIEEPEATAAEPSSDAETKSE